MERGGKLHCISLSGDVHIEGRGLRPQKMIVDSCYRYAAGEQLAHDGIDLILDHDQIAHDHGFAAHGFEGEPATQRERRLDSHTVHGDMQIGSRQAEFMHAAWLIGTCFAERLIDFAPIHIRCHSRQAGQK